MKKYMADVMIELLSVLNSSVFCVWKIQKVIGTCICKYNLFSSKPSFCGSGIVEKLAVICHLWSDLDF